MSHEFEAEVAAAEDKGCRVDMEGTAQVYRCPAELLMLCVSMKFLTSFLGMQTYI